MRTIEQFETESIDAEFDEQFGGFGSGFHEMPNDEPTASDPHPGRFRCDDIADDEDAMNLQVRQEVARLRREVPDLRRFGITPGLYWSGDAENLSVDALPWKVTVYTEADIFIGDGATLADAMTDGLSKYHALRRAKALDAQGVAERAVA